MSACSCSIVDGRVFPDANCRAVFHRDAPPITGEDTKPGKVISRDDVVPKETETAAARVQRMMALSMNEALDEIGQALSIAFMVAIRECIAANLPNLNHRAAELFETQMKGRG